jgi:hypothetical protein
LFLAEVSSMFKQVEVFVFRNGEGEGRKGKIQVNKRDFETKK